MQGSFEVTKISFGLTATVILFKITKENRAYWKLDFTDQIVDSNYNLPKTDFSSVKNDASHSLEINIERLATPF